MECTPTDFVQARPGHVPIAALVTTAVVPDEHGSTVDEPNAAATAPHDATTTENGHERNERLADEYGRNGSVGFQHAIVTPTNANEQPHEPPEPLGNAAEPKLAVKQRRLRQLSVSEYIIEPLTA